jgi:hypothetical protein
MNRYRLSGTVEEKFLNTVIAAYGAAGLQSQIDPEITASLLTKFNELERAPAPTKPISVAEAIHRMHPPAKKRNVAKRTVKTNGGDWPAKGSIYDIVLESLKESPKTPTALREVLKSKDFSPGSVNSALSRLQKANKAGPDGSGAWAATA